MDGKLAGGLYGVVIGRCFFGESMFSDAENGSKIALIKLAQHLAKRNSCALWVRYSEKEDTGDYTFQDSVKAGIYEDLFINFAEVALEV